MGHGRSLGDVVFHERVQGRQNVLYEVGEAEDRNTLTQYSQGDFFRLIGQVWPGDGEDSHDDDWCIVIGRDGSVYPGDTPDGHEDVGVWCQVYGDGGHGRIITRVRLTR